MTWAFTKPSFPPARKFSASCSSGNLENYNFLLEQAAELKNQPQIHPPLLTGNDLMALGVKPGKELGALLAEIRERQLADELPTPDAARAWLKKKLSG